MFEDFGIKSEAAIAGKKCLESVFLKILTNYVNMAFYSVNGMMFTLKTFSPF